MSPIIRYTLSLYFLFLGNILFSQEKVGLVLSGGGATGLAHVGVLKAIEERGIPIDYITGTSAGALVGALYAVGYSPEEIQTFILSDAFQKMTRGEIEPSQRFIYREMDEDASMISFGLSADSLLQKSLPTNFTSSSLLDFVMMKEMGTVSASMGESFDNLFVPFRCVASDVTLKQSKVFSEGKLNEAVRASMTYPFYFKPIKVDGKLLFDGGLYNNFPADVMYNEFNPDYIIGSNVSYNALPPEENDLIGQITNMMVSYSDYSLPCSEGVIIEPTISVTTFDFNNVAIAIQEGYESAQPFLDSIEQNVTRRISKEELSKNREQFRRQIAPLVVTQIHNNAVENNSGKQKDYKFVRRSMIKTSKNDTLNLKTLEKRYFRLYAAEQIDFVYPRLDLREDSTYTLDLEVAKKKSFEFKVGGHFSSRPVNTGFIGLSYHMLGKTASSIYANSYFGKYYGSAKIGYAIEIPSTYPISLSPYFAMNRWDYFRSFATFFEDVKPSFLVQNEIYTGLKVKHPLGNTIKSTIDGKYFLLEDDYYQTDLFTSSDTTDKTNLQGATVSWEIEQNSLNRKQFANSGHYASLRIKYVNAYEHTISGSTAPQPVDVQKRHSWINIKVEFQSYLINFKNFHFGVHGTAVFNSQSLFSNYTASLLAMTAYSPIPDMETFFLSEYRSPQYLGTGINTIFSIKRNLDIRFDGYYYQPFIQIVINDDGTFGYQNQPFKGESFIASSSVVYSSFVGPIRFTTNYFPKQDIPFSFQLSFGYILFNERAIR